MFVTIKVTNGNEIRRLPLQLQCGSELSFARVQAAVKSAFPNLKNKSFDLTWIDDENDTITVSSDVELLEAVRVQTTTSTASVLKFAVKVTATTMQNQVHHPMFAPCRLQLQGPSGSNQQPRRGDEVRCIPLEAALRIAQEKEQQQSKVKQQQQDVRRCRRAEPVTFLDALNSLGQQQQHQPVFVYRQSQPVASDTPAAPVTKARPPTVAKPTPTSSPKAPTSRSKAAEPMNFLEALFAMLQQQSEEGNQSPAPTASSSPGASPAKSEFGSEQQTTTDAAANEEEKNAEEEDVEDVPMPEDAAGGDYVRVESGAAAEQKESEEKDETAATAVLQEQRQLQEEFLRAEQEAVAAAAEAERLRAEQEVVAAAAEAERLHAEKQKQAELAAQWAGELQLLQSMGFSDLAVMLPLLQTYVQVPSSGANGSTAGHVEGMQRVVATLLAKSGLKV